MAKKQVSLCWRFFFFFLFLISFALGWILVFELTRRKIEELCIEKRPTKIHSTILPSISCKISKLLLNRRQAHCNKKWRRRRRGRREKRNLGKKTTQKTNTPTISKIMTSISVMTLPSFYDFRYQYYTLKNTKLPFYPKGALIPIFFFHELYGLILQNCPLIFFKNSSTFLK